MNASMKAEPVVQASRRSKEAGPERLGNRLDVGPRLSQVHGTNQQAPTRKLIRSLIFNATTQ
jgi:hypothetical protein